MRIIIAGGREFYDYEYLKKSVNSVIVNLNKSEIEIVSGVAKGADTLGEDFAREYGYPIKRFHADWDKFKKGAGYKRNAEMAKYSDILIAFWNGESRGTQHMINLANRSNLQVRIFKY